MSKGLTQMKKLQQQIIDAYLQLLHNHSPDEISVKQIVAQAHISRSAFYTHFQDKQAVHNMLQLDITEQFFQFYHSSIHGHLTTLAICQHILKYRHYYKWAFQQPAQIQALSTKLESYLTPVYDDADYAIFAGYGTIGYLKKWVEGDFEMSPQEAAEKLVKIGYTNWAQNIKTTT